MNKFDSILKKVLRENQHDSFGVGNELFDLYNQIDPETKTWSGGRVRDKLEDIINELEEIVAQANKNPDNPETLHNLIKLLERPKQETDSSETMSDSEID